jgi:type VI secretion system secreted protein Hcp
MADNTYLFLKANGADIKGESTVTSQGRENSIECLYFKFNVNTAREAGTGMASGRRQYEPIVIRKRVDKSTPLLFKALVENQVIEAKFLFFRPSRAGDGTTEQYYTIEIKQGRIASINQWSPDSINPAESRIPELEEVTFVFHTIISTYTDGGLSHEDSWAEAR